MAVPQIRRSASRSVDLILFATLTEESYLKSKSSVITSKHNWSAYHIAEKKPPEYKYLHVGDDEDLRI